MLIPVKMKSRDSHILSKPNVSSRAKLPARARELDLESIP